MKRNIEHMFDKKREMTRKSLKSDPDGHVKQAMDSCKDEYHQKILKQTLKQGDR